ncbi:MAG TPA: prepilin-type N-terminal cleavage/methylation domain-containing protein [Candidatus Omnitrophota bacterium]|nr:prepilin-type N-terminal cleavage/methylation domain-containing protein [Candidatus Omnitrophota bacterium]HQL41303.1 prepilin-type N-terminal cleavage/methylation domain-containing protein [Candidatus Omnitrophota bacterium]
MRRADRAFSLVEVIVVVAVCAVVMVLFGSLFVGSWVDYEATMARVNLQERMDNFFIVLEEDVLEASDFTISNNDQRLFLTYPASGFSFSSVSYDFGNGQAVRTTAGTVTGTQTLIVQGLQATSLFLEDASVPNVVVCQLDLEQQVFGRTVSLRGLKRLALRN